MCVKLAIHCMFTKYRQWSAIKKVDDCVKLPAGFAEEKMLK